MEKAERKKRLDAKILSVRPEFANIRSLVLDKSHPLSDLYRDTADDGHPARYKIYWGGRDSAKSWGIAEALIRMAAEQKLFILCVREYQTSIRDSAHRVLKNTIERLGMSAWFDVTQDIIKSRSGSEFVFKGLHNNEQGIRSTEGVDICWVEEAQTVSADSWRSLTPTIRKTNPRRAQIWVSFNLIDENDATYQRLVLKPRTGSIVHNLNFDSNPFFPGSVGEQEMLDDKANDYDLYEHIWLGKPRKKSNAIIFNGKYEVTEFSDELWREAPRLFFGADFGFADDPSTLVRCFILGEGTPQKTLYVDHAIFGKHVDLDDMPAMYDKVPESRNWPIKGDSSRPETISHLRRKGFAIDSAEKWQGSVEDGITHLRGFKKIVIHPRNKEMADEAYMYRYKVDKTAVDEKGQPQVLPIIIDKHNHCLAGGSLITTSRGLVPIEEVRVSDHVMTRLGWRAVVWSGVSGHDRIMVEVRTKTGRLVCCTPDHQIFAAGQFMRADTLMNGDELVVITGVGIGIDQVHSVTLTREMEKLVYDLTIDGVHEFFAGGVLVHNSWDALRYSLDGYIMRSGEIGMWERLGK